MSGTLLLISILRVSTVRASFYLYSAVIKEARLGKNGHQHHLEKYTHTQKKTGAI